MSDAIPDNAIRWSDATGFDEDEYGHEWYEGQHSPGPCISCGLPYNRWMGEPCPSKAVLVRFYVPVEAVSDE